jgi:hypothetical protein
MTTFINKFKSLTAIMVVFSFFLFASMSSCTPKSAESEAEGTEAVEADEHPTDADAAAASEEHPSDSTATESEEHPSDDSEEEGEHPE